MSHDERAVVVVERTSGVGSFLLGILIGAGAALLLAPQSGEETRRTIRERGERLRQRVGDTAEEWQEKVEEGYEHAKQRFEEGYETVRRSVAEKRSGARDAVDAGKAAVHSARDELEQRLDKSRARRKARATEEVAE